VYRRYGQSGDIAIMAIPIIGEKKNEDPIDFALYPDELKRSDPEFAEIVADLKAEFPQYGMSVDNIRFKVVDGMTYFYPHPEN
jgi:hypothetical protein